MEILKNKEILNSLERFTHIACHSLNANTCAIFLNRDKTLDLASLTSASTNIKKNCKIQKSLKHFSWPLEKKEILNVEQYLSNSQALGMYEKDIGIKSLLSLPIVEKDLIYGVLYFDSKKNAHFNENYISLAKDLVIEITKILNMNNSLPGTSNIEDFQSFKKQSIELLDSLGMNSLESIHISFQKLRNTFKKEGFSRTIEFISNLYQEIKKLLPLTTPMYKLPTGEVVIITDSMMTALYKNKISALINSLIRESNIELSFEIQTLSSPKNKKEKSMYLDNKELLFDYFIDI